MLRWLVRAMGLLLLAGAFAAAVIDGARSLADQQLSLTSLGVALATLFPAKIAALPALAGKVHPLLWDPVLLSLLYVPTFLVLALLGVILMLLARSPAGRNISGR